MALLLKNQLRKFLQEKDWSVAQLARAANVPRATVQEWVRGRSPKNLEHVKQVAGILGVTVDVLCFGSGGEAGQESVENPKVKDLSEILGDEWSGLLEVKVRAIKKK